ncbi:prepilin-type N-terminal cleavage/methylation domain-containing protein [Rhizobiales bacterium GAS191]|nr:prepilin-type N-terminal cleavage/methylation domain-containing protein [Rhizobiales bacterium GAS113]SED86095.1 prepilin-type N-terminal cleavage/methylation domain-containing protein [Rhizobiales bacterium GAS191]SEE60740.1 prepilin-type N-terminal cleavage/methylation domain-containing protein [Rhizobiales bacterium GAS188]
MTGDRDGGFTLLEVLVALVILVLALAGFYRAFGVGLSAGSTADRERRQIEAAEGVLVELGRSRPLQDGVSTGELSDGQRWTFRLEPFVPFEQNGSPSPLTGHLATLEVLPADGRGAPLRLQTLVIGVTQ